MFRRIVCWLMLPCLLLTQSVALGHAHAEGQSAGHDLQPHFHTGKPAVIHGHHHDSGGHHHHHHHDEVDLETPSPATPNSDHDSDAVYLAPADALVERGQSLDNVRSLSWITSIETVSNLQPFAIDRGPRLRPPPDVRLDLLPIYIRHLTLLI